MLSVDTNPVIGAASQLNSVPVPSPENGEGHQEAYNPLIRRRYKQIQEDYRVNNSGRDKQIQDDYRVNNSGRNEAKHGVGCTYFHP